MTPIASAAHDWLLRILQGLVVDPASVSVEVRDCNGGLEFTIITDRSTRGRIIGRSGRTINLVRELAFVYAQTQHLSKITLIVSEPERITPHATAEHAAR